MSKKVKGHYNFPTIEVDDLKENDMVLLIPNAKQFDYEDWDEFCNRQLDFSLKQYCWVSTVTKRKIFLIELGLCNSTGAWHTELYSKKELKEKYSFIKLGHYYENSR